MPSGLVTFLFTDIEGSTRLAQLLGAGYRPVLHAHRQVLRRVLGAGGGVELFAEGDSFFFAFPDAAGALSSCLSAQRTLADHQWPSANVAPKVRMGLHSGWARPQEGEYASPEVHLAARIAAAAHGGQVLCSAATAERATPLADDTWLRDLGLFRLRGFDGRERLFQLVAPGLAQGFPRPRTELASPHNLPAPITSFVGRDYELAQLVDLLDQHRLVTVVGPAGGGKTRLALQVADGLLDDYPDGVWFVDLSAVTEPGLVAVAVAAALGLRPEPGRPVLQTLSEHLANRRMLLMLDTCDAQIAAAASVAAGVLTGGRGSQVLATSREPLGIPGELVWRIPSLSLTNPDGTAGDAVRLLAERAAAARGGTPVAAAELPSLTRIAGRLDGLPLAIELAAGRLRTIGAAQLAERMAVELAGGDLLSTIDAAPTTPAGPTLPRQRPPTAAVGPVPPAPPAQGEPAPSGPVETAELPGRRHATLQSAVGSSYRTLPDEPARLLRALSVFAGPVDLDTAGWLLGSDPVGALTVLVDKSLLHAAPAATPEPVGTTYSYRLLDPIRAFAARELAAAGEEQATRARHVDWALSAVRSASRRADDRPATLSLHRLDPYTDEVRTALHWSVVGGSAGAGLQLAGALDQWWRERGLAREGRLWLFRLYGRLAETGEPADDRVLTEAYYTHSLQASADGEYVESMRYSQLAEESARRLADPGLLGQVLAARCWSLLDLDRPAQAEHDCRELISWAAQQEVTEVALFAIYCLAHLLWRRGELDEAAELLGAARPAERARPDVRGRRSVDMLLGMVALARGDLVAAHDHLVVALRSRMAYGFHTRALDTLAAMAVRCAQGGQLLVAARLFGAVHAHRARLRVKPGWYAAYWAEQESALQAALGDDEFDREVAAGAELDLAQAAETALAVDQEVPAVNLS